MEQLLDEILQLLSESLENAEEILKITEEMKEYIRRQDMDSLNRALDMRQTRIDRINFINAAVGKKKKELAAQFSVRHLEEIDKSRYPEAEEIRIVQERIEKTSRQIYGLEKNNLRNAQALLEEFRDTIKGIQRNQKAMRIYNGGSPEKQSILLNEVK